MQAVPSIWKQSQMLASLLSKFGWLVLDVIVLLLLVAELISLKRAKQRAKLAKDLGETTRKINSE